MRIYIRECPFLPLVTIFKSRENFDSRKKRTPSNAARLDTTISKANIRNHDATVQAWKLSGAHVRKVSPKNMGAKPRVRRRVRCEFRGILTVHDVHGIARDDEPSQQVTYEAGDDVNREDPFITIHADDAVNHDRWWGE
jgi:hypothetical protein